MHEEVRKFWEAHYSANVMRASLVSRHSLDELESFAGAAFSGIANKRLAAPRFTGKYQYAAWPQVRHPVPMVFCIRAACQAGSFVCFPSLPRPRLPLASMGSSRHCRPSACMHRRCMQTRRHEATLTSSLARCR